MTTKILKNGTEVLANQEEDGAVYATTYANRTQADNKAAKLGAGWTVYQFGRPFYVGKVKSENSPKATAQHTPGPWKLQTPSGIFAPTGTVLATAYHMGTEPNNEREANARLICAAPDLLEALEPFTLLNPLHCPDYAGSIEIARAAIAKARGQ